LPFVWPKIPRYVLLFLRVILQHVIIREKGQAQYKSKQSGMLAPWAV